MYAKKENEFLRFAGKCRSGKQRKEVFKTASRDQILALCECSHNALYGRLPLSPAEKEKLKKHKALVRHLADSNISWRKKKDTLSQKGGGAFIPALLGPVLAALVTILGN